MKKYAFFLDIDGTLYDGKCIPEGNIRAINRAVSEGHYVFISTGRGYKNIGDKILDAAPWSGVVAAAGAEIRIGDEVIRKNVSTALAFRVVELAFKRDGWTCLSNKDETIAINLPEREEWYHPESTEQVKKCYPDLSVTKIDLSGEMSCELVSAIEEEMYLHYYDIYCEAVVKGCSKSEAMKYVGDRLAIPLERRVAMGDSVNDKDALIYAGISVAMGNAPNDIKELADFVTLSASDAGVGKAMEKILYEL